MKEIDWYYLTECDEEEGIKRMNKENIQQRIDTEHELMQPYIDLLRGVREVPRSELYPIFDEAVISGIESGKLSQKLNKDNVIVVYKVSPKNSP